MGGLLAETYKSAETGWRHRWGGVGLWLICCCLLLASIAFSERKARVADLTAQSARLHATASQRADQHDAHLTALSAVAVAGADQRPDLFREVAGAIIRFYPRIRTILLLPLDGRAGVLGVGEADAGLSDIVIGAVARSTGAPVLVRHPSDPSRYIMVKRSPNSDRARYGLALVVDAAALVAGESDYWGKAGPGLRLSMPDGTPLFETGSAIAEPQFARPLSSGTQPLRLETAIALDALSLFPPRKVAISLVLLTLGALGVRAALRQRQRARAAERRAELSGFETRLSHASRVNALGELASGMAHELTQPLTAILAQGQAARRLAAKGEAVKVGKILEELIGQTKRASAILERLRTWTQPQARRPERVDLRDCILMVESLLGRDAAEQGVDLVIRLPAHPVPVLIDRIEIEQVFFNIVRNALDAVGAVGDEREVILSLAASRDTAVVDVIDTGPGVGAEVRDNLFTPFVTTRDDGTGLGLALSLRLAERAGGDIALVDRPRGAHFRISLPLAEERREAAE